MKSRSFHFLFIIVIAIGALFLVAMPLSARAQTPTPPSDDAVNAIARQLFCPICENTPLDVCPTVACRDWRELIRQMLTEGKSEEQIKQYFVDNYGARVLGAPPAQGINLLAYIVPPVIFLVGIFLLFQAFRTWKRMAVEVSPETVSKTPSKGKNSRSALDDEYIARLEAELKKRK